MINLTMNMPFSLMGFYGSIMIVTVLVLRGLLKSRLPKFVFPLFWGVILLRLLIPFSLSSPLSMKVPDFFRNPFYEAASMINLIEDLPMTAEMNVATAQNQPKTIVPETTVLETTALETTALETTALETTASETIVSEAIISEIPLEA